MFFRNFVGVIIQKPQSKFLPLTSSNALQFYLLCGRETWSYVRKDLWDSSFTSLLDYYNSPGCGQQGMTCMLSTRCSIWNQVGHICPKGPSTVWCTDLQLLYVADTRWWPAAQHVLHWLEPSPTPFTWTCMGFFQWPKEAQSQCSVVALLYGVMVTKERGVRTES